MLRRSLFLLALLIALPAAAREAPYLTAEELDLVAILPPPIAAGSEGDRAQQEVVLRAQRTATPERIEQARHDVDESLDSMFGSVFGKPLPAQALPDTTRLFERIGETEEVAVSGTKKAFQKLRPYLSNSEIKPLVRPSVSGSYPSGHTTHVTVAAIVLGEIVPEKRDAIWQRSGDYAWSRVIGGMHYPNDLDGGRLAGTAIAVALRDRPAFKTDFAAARKELRQFLGLAP